MRVIYTIGTRLGSGIGLTAQKGIDGLERAGVLQTVITPQELGERPPQGDIDFDSRAAQVLESMQFDVLVAWNNMAVEQQKVARAKGAKSVVIRASTHPRHQQRIMRQEWAKLGVLEDPFPDQVVERCEAEFELADKVIIPTEYVWATMVANGVPEAKLVKVPHGVDLEAFKFEEQPPHFMPCFIGGNWVRKGLRYLLEGWRGPLQVAGCNPPPQLMALNPDAKALGFAPSIRQVLRESSVLCLPTLEEGQALVLLEAASMGRAIVTSAASGAMEFLEDQKSCLIVNPMVPGNIRDALSYLRDNEGVCREMGKAARTAVEAYPWSRYGDGVAKVCREVHGG